MGQKYDTLEEAVELIKSLNKQVAALQQMVVGETCKHLADGAIQYWAKESLIHKKQSETLLAALEEIEDARKEEEDYRWENIGKYPPVKIPDGVRAKWIDDLKVIAIRQHKARENAVKVIADAKKVRIPS